MNEPLKFIYEALGVPYGLLATEEASKRSAAAQLLRRIPRLRNILEVEQDPDYPFTDELRVELQLILETIERLLDLTADALADGSLDSIIGGYPVPGLRPWEVIVPLSDRIRESVGPEAAAESVDDVLERAGRPPTVLPIGYNPDPWLKVILETLLLEIAETLGRKGWPRRDNEAPTKKFIPPG
jgi:hypothetical protein